MSEIGIEAKKDLMILKLKAEKTFRKVQWKSLTGMLFHTMFAMFSVLSCDNGVGGGVNLGATWAVCSYDC